MGEAVLEASRRVPGLVLQIEVDARQLGARDPDQRRVDRSVFGIDEHRCRPCCPYPGPWTAAAGELSLVGLRGRCDFLTVDGVGH
jgi:hypothetical protein